MSDRAARLEELREITGGGSISALKKCTELDLGDKSLTSVPPGVCDLRGLVWLELCWNRLSSLPPEISQLTGLTYLDVSSNQLSSLPPEISRLTGLTYLNVRYNQLSSLPPEISQLTGLAYLNIQNNQLSSLPPEISQLTRLMGLNVSSNQLSSLPPEISQLTGLAWLNVSSNRLSSLPPEISQLTGLIKLNVSSNQLSPLPQEISQLTGLTYLNVSSNQLSSLPPEISQLTGLAWLNVSSNQLSLLPPEISQLTGLIKLNVQNNQLSSLPPEISQLTRFAYLYVDNNQLSSLPQEISRLTGLTVLNIQNNQLSSLPPEISRLTGLTELNVNYNQLSSLPPEMSQLTRLVFLNIDQNKISSIPNMQALTELKKLNIQQNSFPAHVQHFLDSIELEKDTIHCSGKELKQIPQELFLLPMNPKKIDLSNNQIQHIPENIVNLVNLANLNISNNKIENIPSFLANIPTLRSGLIINRNPIKNVPQNVIRQGSEAVFDFLTAAAKDGIIKWRQGRLLLLGEGEAGKTTLTKSITQQSRDFQSTIDISRQRTDGIEQVEVDIHEATLGESGEPISVCIWDFGGQEEFQVTHPFFLSYGALVLILYRLDRSKEKNNISRWINMLDEFAPGSKIIVVGTHQDTENSEYAQGMKQEIDSIKRENKRHTFISTELKVSNMSGIRISDLKKVIYEGMVQLDNIKIGVPESYITLKERLESKGKQQKYENIQDIYNFAEKELKMDQNQCESALKFLHDLGSVVWYSSFENLKDIVFLDPLFLINVFRCVFSFKGVGKGSSGIILLTKLKEKIKQELNVELDEHIFSTIINIFDHFGLGIKFNKECIAFPSLMEDCQNIRVLWNEKPETNCVSEISAVLISDGEVQLSDKSNIIVQALRLTKGALSEIQYEDYFFSDVALIHLKASYGKESEELNLVPGNEFIIFIQIHKSNISIKIRKYDSNYGESMEPVRIFDVLYFFIKQISAIRPNLIENCQLQCPECRLNGVNGRIETSSKINEFELIFCSRDHQLDTKIVKQGRVYLEQGISKRVHSVIKAKRGKKKQTPDEILKLESVDEKLKGVWMKEQAELVEYIGKGAYGRVYKTKYKGNDFVVKIQTIKQTGEQTISRLIESLILESNYLHECRENENIVRLFGVYRKDDDFFMIMEHAGISLKTILEWNQVKLEDAMIVSYAKQICQGLIFMHSKNLYHEDLKADNIMIVNEKVKIVDFGIVSRRGLEKVGSNLPTRFGEWKQGGTSNWQAPEIHEVVCKPYYEDVTMYGEDGVNIGHRGEPSNLYALGMLVWYMFSGIEPFNHEAHPESFTMKGLRPEIPSSTPIEFIHVIKACWKQNYKLRPTLQMVCEYLDTLSSKQFKLSQKEMVELLPIKYPPLMDMYLGEFVEWLQDHQITRFSQVIAFDESFCPAEISKLDNRALAREFSVSEKESSFLLDCINDLKRFDENMESRSQQGAEIFQELRDIEEINVRFTPSKYGVEQATCLWMAEKKLFQLPDSLRKLTNIQTLYLHSNKLTQFPGQCLELVNLSSLDISNNQISSIPSDMSRLLSLSRLDVHNNPIQELPIGITALTNLGRLCVQNEKGQSSIMRAPRGITRLPCWHESSNPDYQYIAKLMLYDHDASVTRKQQSISSDSEEIM